MTEPNPELPNTPLRSRLPRGRWPALIGMAVLMLASVLVYRGVLHQPLESDARFLTTQNNIVTDGTPAEFFTRDFFEGADTRGFIYLSGYYRPITNTLFWLQYRMGGDNAWFYNLSGFLLHGLNAALLALFVAGVGRSRMAGMLAGALWVVHPVHAFAVTEPAAMGDLLATTFSLGALLAFARVVGMGGGADDGTGTVDGGAGSAGAPGGLNHAWVAGSTVLFLLAVLSKESGITFPAAAVALVLLAHYRDDIPLRPGLLATVPLWGTFIAYLGWRFGVLGILPGTVGYADQVGSVALAVGVMKTVVIHLARIVVPLGWQFPEMHPSMVATANADPSDPLTLVAIVIVLGGGALALLWRSRPELAFWAALFWITYSPLARADNIGGSIGTTALLAQERWIYLPAIAVIGGLAVLLSRTMLSRTVQSGSDHGSRPGTAAARAGGDPSAVAEPVGPSDELTGDPAAEPARPSGRIDRRFAIGAVVVILAGLSWTAAIHARVQRDQLAQLAMLYEIPDAALGRVGLANRLMYYAYRVSLPQGDLPDAVSRAEQAVELVPDSPIFARALAGLRGMQGDWSGARDLVRPWIDPDSTFLARQSETNYRVYDDLNRVAPELWLVLGEAEGQMGDAVASESAFCGALQRRHRTDLVAAAVERTPGVELPLDCSAI